MGRPVHGIVMLSVPHQRTTDRDGTLLLASIQAVPSPLERKMNYLLTMHFWNPIQATGALRSAGRKQGCFIPIKHRIEYSSQYTLFV